MNPTQEQLMALETVQNGENLKLNAFAGTGKTSTLVLMANALAPKRGLYLAFNKGIKEEAEAKMPRNVTARTFHSMAYGSMPNWMRTRFNESIHINEFCKKFQLFPITYRARLESYHKSSSNGKANIISVNEQKKISSYKIKRLTDMALNVFMSSTDDHPKSNHTYDAIMSDMPNLRKESETTFEKLTLLITPIIQYLWADYSSPEGQLPINANHAVYFKYWAVTNPIIKYDFVLFDEAQDADPLMLQILEKQECQVIYVGDKHQQIYAWRGAVNALEQIAAKELYLTKSFRFGQALADQCKPILNTLKETQQFKGTDHPTVINNSSIKNITDYKKYNACLCRTNAEVVLTVLELAGAGVACKTNIDTKSIVDTLFDMRELQENAKTVDLAQMDLPMYKTKNNKINFHSWEEFVTYMNDFNNEPELAITFNIFMKYKLGEITDALKIAKHKDGVTVTTAHKAKGLEWDSVILKGDFLKGFFEYNQETIKRRIVQECSIYDHDVWVNNGGKLTDVVPVIRTSESVEDELRLLYVALTRAKKMLDISMVDEVFTDFFKMNSLLKKG